MTTVTQPHGVPGASCSLGSFSDVPPSIAPEEFLVSGCKQSGDAGSSNSGVCRVLVAAERKVIVRSSSSGASSLSSAIHRHFANGMGHSPS